MFWPFIPRYRPDAAGTVAQQRAWSAIAGLVTRRPRVTWPLTALVLGAALVLTGGVITSAGLVLAATFSVLTVLPVVFTVQLGLLVAVGILLDTFLVRALLVSSLTVDIGPRIWWPGRLSRLHHQAAPPLPRDKTHHPGGGTGPPRERPPIPRREDTDDHCRYRSTRQNRAGHRGDLGHRLPYRQEPRRARCLRTHHRAGQGTGRGRRQGHRLGGGSRPGGRFFQKRGDPAKAARVCAELAWTASPAEINDRYVTERGKPGRYPAAVTERAAQDRVIGIAENLARHAPTAVGGTTLPGPG